MKLPSFFVFFIFTTTIDANVDQCHSKLLAGCFCGNTYFERKNVFMVNCTNTNFKDTKMLESLPEQTQVLIFSGNHIPVLEMNIFGETVDLSDLSVIDMSNNGITEIKGKAFHHVPEVELLILNHNNLRISADRNLHHPRVFSNFYNLQQLHLTNAFADNTGGELANDLHDIFVNSNLTKLFKLHLEQNEIQYFNDTNVFCDLPNIQEIYLGDNNLPGLNFNLTCLKKLRYLDLEHNNIVAFEQKELNEFDKLAPPHRNSSDGLLVEIGHNPLRCERAMKGLYDWLRSTNVKVRNKNYLECYRNSGGVMALMNLKHFGDARQARVSQALTVLLVVLVIVLVSLLATYVYLRKEDVRRRLSPLLDVVTRKVHYTHIESQDV